jgi:predicted ribosomally synthesized peptide with nif11-like leader
MSHSALDALQARLAADPAFAAQFRAAASLDAALAVARAHGLTLDAAALQNRPLGTDELDQVAGAISIPSYRNGTIDPTCF